MFSQKAEGSRKAIEIAMFYLFGQDIRYLTTTNVICYRTSIKQDIL